VTLSKPTPIVPETKLSSCDIPVLCLVDALQSDGWTPHAGRVFHERGSEKQYDCRHLPRQRRYLQCLLLLPTLLKARVLGFPSGCPAAWYHLLMRVQKQMPANISAKECARQLALLDGGPDLLTQTLLSRRPAPPDAKKREWHCRPHWMLMLTSLATTLRQQHRHQRWLGVMSLRGFSPMSYRRSWLPMGLPMRSSSLRRSWTAQFTRWQGCSEDGGATMPDCKLNVLRMATAPDHDLWSWMRTSGGHRLQPCTWALGFTLQAGCPWRSIVRSSRHEETSKRMQIWKHEAVCELRKED
jgi:hypothetical protein